MHIFALTRFCSMDKVIRRWVFNKEIKVSTSFGICGTVKNFGALKTGIEEGIKICHGASKDAGWYTDIRTGEPLQRNKGEMLCLIHSEISEAMEGIRKNRMDDKLPHRHMGEVELADTIIRIFDFAGYCGYDLAGAIVEKIEYNAKREDHKIENRKADGGKQF